MELCGTAHLHHTTHQPVYERFHHYSSSTEYVNRHHSDFIRIVLSITRAIQNPRSVTSCNHMFEGNEKMSNISRRVAGIPQMGNVL